MPMTTSVTQTRQQMPAFLSSGRQCRLGKKDRKGKTIAGQASLAIFRSVSRNV